MKNWTSILLKVITFLLVLLWVYSAVSKLSNFYDFRLEMFRQELPRWMRLNLVWILPPIELIAAGLLLFKNSEYAGYWISFVLMALFTVYVGLVVAGYYKQVPCSCGGVIKAMGWNAHLAFNLFFLLLACTGIFLFNRERREWNSTK